MSNGGFKLLVGLGNPGTSYKKTRHNVGFMVMERLAKKHSAGFKLNKKLCAQIADIGQGSEKQRLLMPNTFMNDSGRSIRSAMDWFDVQNSQLLIIVDDIDLPIGKIRFRAKGSSGGHNGLKSIMQSIGNQDFCRVKIGIGHPFSDSEDRKQKTISHVLGTFNSYEAKVMEKVLDEVIKGLGLINTDGLEIGANHINSFRYIDDD